MVENFCGCHHILYLWFHSSRVLTEIIVHVHHMSIVGMNHEFHEDEFLEIRAVGVSICFRACLV